MTASSLPATIGKFVRWHRRPIGTIAAIICLLSLTSVLSGGDTAGVPVVVAAHTLDAGTTVTEDDVELQHIPEKLLPEAAVRDPADVVGRMLSGGASAGSVITELDILGSGPGASGQLVPFRVVDSDLLSLVQVGDIIDVIGSGVGGESTRLATGVRVAALPRDSTNSQSGGLIVVEADDSTAHRLASASTHMQLTFVLV